MLLLAPLGPAAPRYSESFDSAETAKVLERKPANSEAFYVNYSAIVRNQTGSVGPVTVAIPEAPNRIAGSSPTRGVLLDVIYPNINATRTINLLAAASPGGAEIVFSGDYRMAFDKWLAMDPVATVGTTEVGLLSIGHSGTNTVSYVRRASGVGTFGWASTEGGLGSSSTNGDIGLYIEPIAAFLTENLANSANYLWVFPKAQITMQFASNSLTSAMITSPKTKLAQTT